MAVQPPLVAKPFVTVIGAGYWGRNLVRNFQKMGALAGICDTDGTKLSELRRDSPHCRHFGSFADALRDNSTAAVVIATPAETHAALVREALLADKDVFVEKPLCLTVMQGEELVALAQARHRILMVGHLLWYHPAVLKLRELIGSGDLGRIQYIYSQRLNLGRIRREENILWSFAPHDISVILGLLGEMPCHIQASGGNYLHRQIADVTVSLLSFPSGVKAHVFVSWLHPFKEQKLVVVGDRKMAVFNDVEKEDKLLLYPHRVDWKNQIPVILKADAQSIPLNPDEPLLNECLHFVDCIRTRKTPRTDGAEGLNVLRVLEQCQAALESEPTAKRSAQPVNKQYTVHESAFIDDGVEIGHGTTIWHVSHILKGTKIGENCRIGQNVVIGPRATIGNDVKIQNNVSVYEGVTLEDEVFCGPSTVFTNVINPRSKIPRMNELKPTLICKGATLGANSTIVCGITVGRYGFVGAGAVVTKNIPDYALAVGNPARIVGWMCACGVKIAVDGKAAQCNHCGAMYHKEKDRLIPLSSKVDTPDKHRERSQ